MVKFEHYDLIDDCLMAVWRTIDPLVAQRRTSPTAAAAAQPETLTNYHKTITLETYLASQNHGLLLFHHFCYFAITKPPHSYLNSVKKLHHFFSVICKLEALLTYLFQQPFPRCRLPGVSQWLWFESWCRWRPKSDRHWL